MACFNEGDKPLYTIEEEESSLPSYLLLLYSFCFGPLYNLVLVSEKMLSQKPQ
jgi:hypothetical protein